MVVFTPDTNPYNLRNNGSLPSQYDGYVNCQDPPDSYGVCDKWFFDGKDAYMLFKYSNPNDDQYSLLETMFTEGWTTGQLLFDGALACAINTAVHSTPATPDINVTTLQSYCVSSLEVSMYLEPKTCSEPQEGIKGPQCPVDEYQGGVDCFWKPLFQDGCNIDEFVYYVPGYFNGQTENLSTYRYIASLNL